MWIIIISFFDSLPNQIPKYAGRIRHLTTMCSRFSSNRQRETDKRLMFTVGKKAEVTFDTEASKHIWFPVKVLEHKGDDFFLVEYQKYNSCGDPCIVQQTVESFQIRPSPPHLKEKNFFLLEKVDAFYDFGWRSGVITQELADSKYMVFFKHAENQREFSFLDLRPHMEWKDGKWFNTSQRENFLPETGDRRYLSVLSVLCQFHKDVSAIPTDYQTNEGDDGESANDTAMVTQLGSSVSTRNAPDDKIPSSLMSEENQIDLEIPFIDEALDIDSSPRERVADPSFDVVGKEKLQWDMRSVASSLTTRIGEIESTSEGNLSNVAGPALEIAENALSSQFSRTDLLSVNHSLHKILKRKQMDFEEQEERLVACSRKTRERSMHIQVKKTRSLAGLACGDTRSTGSKISSRSNCEEPMKNTEDWNCFDEAELHTVEVTNQFEVQHRSQRRRLPKPIAEGSTTSFSDNEDAPLINVKIATTTDVSTLRQVSGINGGCKKKLMNNQITLENDLDSDAMSWLRLGRENLVEASVKQCKIHSLREDGERNINLNLIAEVECNTCFLLEGDGVVSPNTQKEKAAEVNCGIDMNSVGSPNNPFDVQLLTNSVGDESQTTIGSSASTETRNTEQYTVVSGEQTDIIKETPAFVDERGTDGSESHCLPFMKASPLWSTIESMEVFLKRPQHPHFRPLEHRKESSREGLAIGCMVTFASVVEKTSKVQFDDSQLPMDDILETLLELETHGFSVGFVRDRISYLRRKREEMEKLQEEMEKLNNEMISHNLEKSKIDEEMEEISHQIKELEGKLSEVFSKKDTKVQEIGLLQSKLKSITEGIQCGFGEQSVP